MSALRKELIELVTNIPDIHLERILQMAKILTKPTKAEQEKWWAENVYSKPGVLCDLSDEDVKRIESSERISFEQLKKELGYNNNG